MQLAQTTTLDCSQLNWQQDLVRGNAEAGSHLFLHDVENMGNESSL